MSHFHSKKTRKADKEAHVNWMGGKSFDIGNPILNLRIAASSCFFGEPQYYHQDKNSSKVKEAVVSASALSSLSLLDSRSLSYLRETLNAIDPQEWRSLGPSKMMEDAIDKALEYNVEATLQEAVRLRQGEHIRTTPQVILVRAANHKKAKGLGLIRQYAKDIIARADEPSVGLAYQLWRYGDKAPIPNALKKAWKDALERFNEYQISKYRMENRDVKTVDVVNLVHPKSSVISDLVQGKLKTTDKTWESIISAEGSSKETWTKAVDVMGHMALLRNLRNFEQNKVPESVYLDKLVGTAKKGKQLPFRYVSAYKAVESVGGKGNVLDAIEECLQESLGNLPHLDGKVMSLCDNSGSAWGTTTSSMGTMEVATIANLTGIIGTMIADEGYVGVFGDGLKKISIRKKASVFHQLKEVSAVGQTVGQATENGIWLFWDKAIKEKEHWDHVFIFSDMQAGHGGLYGVNPRQYKDYVWNPHGSTIQYGYGSSHIDVPKLISTYRTRVNPDVKVFCVQVAGYQDTIIPEFYNKTYILGGWSENLFRFAAEMANIDQKMKQ